MPSDEEFRRVAEDLRGLARSLARDMRDAADRMVGESRGAGPRPSSADAAEDGPDGAQQRQGKGACGPRYPGPPSWNTHRRRRRQRYGVGPSWWTGSGWTGSGWTGSGAGAPTTAPAPPGAGPAGGDGEGEGGGAGRDGRDAAVAAATWPVVAPAPPAPKLSRRASRPPLRHRKDGTTLVGSLALVFGVAWLAARTHTMSVSTEAVVAIALMLVGATMVVTARTDWALSRRIWPALAGAVLVMFAVSASPSLGVPANWRDLKFGSQTVRYTSWQSVPAVVRGGVGRTLVDLSGLGGPPAADTSLEVDATVGAVIVLLPPGVHTVVDADLAAGNILVNDVEVDKGLRPHVHEDLSPGVAGPRLVLRVRSGPGALKITQLSAAPAVPVSPAAPSGPSNQTVFPTPTTPTTPETP